MRRCPPRRAPRRRAGPPRARSGCPPPPPPSASSGGPLSNVTSSLRRAGTQVKRFGRKILADTTSVLPGGFQSKDRVRDGPSAHGAAVKRDDDADGADATSPGSKITPRITNSRPRYLDLGPLDPRKVLQDSLRFADSADPPEGYVNVWQGNFRRWQKRWLAATTPGVLTMHRRASKLGPSVSVDLTAAAVLVNESGKNGVVLEPNSKQKSTSGSSRQFLIVTPDKTYRIRVLHARCRAPWVDCVERSAERLERARALVRSRGKFSISSGGSFSGRSHAGSFSSKPPLAEKRHEKQSLRNAKRPEKQSSENRRASSEFTTRGAHRRTPSGRETFVFSSSAESRAAVRRALHDAFLSFESNPALHAAREHAEVLASKTRVSERTAASSFVGVVGSFMGGGDKEPVEEEEDDEAVLPGAGRPRDVVAAVAALRAAYDSTLSALLERCAAAEEQSTRHQLRSANLAAALAEFTGVVPSPGAAAGEAHVGFGRGPVAGSGQGGGSLSLSLDEARETNAETREVEIVTPGQSGFAAALRGRGGAERDEKNRDQADGDGSGSQLSDSASSGASDEYGSVLSFATGVSGGSGVVFNQDDVDDLDLLVAAEVVNRHDFVISRSRALNGEISPAERDDDDDDDAISDDDATSVSSGAAEISNSESESEEDDVYGRLPRERLPAPQPLNQSFSIWDLLRKNMGKDLSRISMPANINQPLSLLQRTVEDFEYLDLLYRAIDCDGVATSEKTEQEYGTDTQEEKKSTDRVALLALFAASSYASWYGRAQKPFASTLGETFDWTSPDGNVRVVCECVVYDPPVAAVHASGVTPKGTPFVVHGEGMGTSKFYGRYVQVNVKGGLHLELPLTRERYSWSKAAMHVHNVISGRVWVDMVGEVSVIAHPVFGRDQSTGEVSVKSGGERASFKLLKGSKPVAGKADTRGALVGGVFDRNGAKTASISGNCLDALWLERDETYNGDAPLRHVTHESHEKRSVSESVRDPSAADPSAPPDASASASKPATVSGPNDTGKKVDAPAWRFGGVARDAARQYGFTKFAISLNELTPEGTRNLPPTDSRFRPDMRALENGDSEEASRAKVRVEDRNRALLAARRKKGEAYAPAWFKKRTRSIKNDGIVPDGFDDLSGKTSEEPFGVPSSPVSSPASEKSTNGETEPVQRKELGSSNPSSPGSSVKSGAAFGKHVNTLENRTSLWVYKGAYWEQRLTGEYVDPEVVTDERFDVFGLAAAWRAERDRRREKRAIKSEADVPPREDHKR